MKPSVAQSVRRAALLLPALGLLLAPLGAQAREREDRTLTGRDAPTQTPDMGLGGRAGAIEEFNFGPTGTDVILQREDGRNEGGVGRVLSGRVIELKGKTLYVDRGGVVVPLDTSALRITKQPKVGQEIIASYEVRETDNVALSLAGEVDPAQP
jgi:plasmid stabilization system protein ParE